MKSKVFDTLKTFKYLKDMKYKFDKIQLEGLMKICYQLVFQTESVFIDHETLSELIISYVSLCWEILFKTLLSLILDSNRYNVVLNDITSCKLYSYKDIFRHLQLYEMCILYNNMINSKYIDFSKYIKWLNTYKEKHKILLHETELIYTVNKLILSAFDIKDIYLDIIVNSPILTVNDDICLVSDDKCFIYEKGFGMPDTYYRDIMVDVMRDSHYEMFLKRAKESQNINNDELLEWQYYNENVFQTVTYTSNSISFNIPD